MPCYRAEVDHGDWPVVTIRDRCLLQARLKTKLGRMRASGVEHRNGQGYQHGVTKGTFAARREGRIAHRVKRSWLKPGS